MEAFVASVCAAMFVNRYELALSSACWRYGDADTCPRISLPDDSLSYSLRQVADYLAANPQVIPPWQRA